MAEPRAQIRRRLVPISQLLPTITAQSHPASSNRTLTAADFPSQFLANASTNLKHEVCIQRITDYIDYTTLHPNETLPYSLLFGEDTANHEFLTTPTNMVVTVPFCELLCSNPAHYAPFRDWYPDRGPRIMTWIVPVALLLSSIELSPLDKRRFYAVLHALGDPIDVLWSFLHKLRVRTRLHALAEAHFGANPDPSKNQDALVATVVLSAFEDLLSPSIRSYNTFRDLLHVFWIPQARHLWRDAALDLADSRSDERLRSMLAVALYVLQILSAFIVDIGGGPSNPPGGVIAVALTLTFLIPTVLFSSWIGAPTSRRGTLRAVRTLVDGVEAVRVKEGLPRLEGKWMGQLPGMLERAGIPLAAVGGVPVEAPARFREGFDFERDTIYAEYHLHGGKDTYRPWKLRVLSDDPLSPRGWRIRWRDVVFWNDAGWEAFLASLPVYGGVVPGLGILFLAGEGGFSCRHVLLLSILGAWTASAVLTSFSYKYMLRLSPSGKWHWRFCLVKGLVVGTGVLVFVGLTAAGFFNTCACWGRRLSRGSEAQVALSVNERNWKNVEGKFPGIVAALIFFQVGYAVWVLLANRNGVRVLRWSEGRKQAAWLDKKLPPQGVGERVRGYFGDSGLEAVTGRVCQLSRDLGCKLRGDGRGDMYVAKNDIAMTVKEVWPPELVAVRSDGSVGHAWDRGEPKTGRSRVFLQAQAATR